MKAREFFARQRGNFLEWWEQKKENKKKRDEQKRQREEAEIARRSQMKIIRIRAEQAKKEKEKREKEEAGKRRVEVEKEKAREKRRKKEEKKENKAKEKDGTLGLWLFIVLIILVFFFVFVRLFAGSTVFLFSLSMFTVVSIVAAAVIWWVLAPRNLFFTFVKEGTAKVIVKGDAVSNVLIQYRGKILDKNWSVVMGDKGHWFGGFRWYGFWPILDVFIHKFRWSGVTERGEVVVHPTELMDYILLKDDVYYFVLEEAEDKEKLPLRVEILLTLRVVNPYKALFAVQNWLETVINRYKPMVRDRVASETYEELLGRKGSLGGELFQASQELREEEFRDRYGVEVVGVEVKEINPPTNFREATLKKWSAERDAEAEIARANGRAKALAERIMGSVIISLAKANAKTAEEIGVAISAGQYKEDIKTLLNEARRREEIDKNLVFEQIFPEGIEGTAFGFLAAALGKKLSQP